MAEPAQTPSTADAAPILSVRDFRVRFATPDGSVEAVDGVDLDVLAGECVGVVGESGSGKSQLFLGAFGLLAGNGAASGTVLYRGRPILNLAARELNKIRGRHVTMIFQDPLTSLTPHLRVGDQLAEVLKIHRGMARHDAYKQGLALLDRVRIPDAATRLHQYPHELSGGMRQRVMIAMALLCGPDLIIADEPTTALDVTVQAQILDLLHELKDDLDSAIVLISHDLGVVAGLCDRIQVMRDGRFVETGTTAAIFYRPRHDYTKMLLASMPRIDEPDKAGLARVAPLAANAPELLSVTGLKVHFPIRTGGTLIGRYRPLKAVDGVSFALAKGETLGIVGESGSGKSTLARAILQLVPQTEGAVVWDGRPLAGSAKQALRDLRREFQIVFQDPLASLDPRMTIGESVAEPLGRFRPDLDARARRQEVRAMLERVGLDPKWVNRYPHEFSGGQNQRVGIARAMIAKPKLVICDEAVSALDVSVRGQILSLLLELQQDLGLSMIFISHDLSVVRQVSHRVLVMFLGRIVELADRDTIYQDARHPYTQSLISAAPIPDPAKERAKPRLRLETEIPSPLDPEAALYFLPSKRGQAAADYRPPLIEVAPGHLVAEHDPITK